MLRSASVRFALLMLLLPVSGALAQSTSATSPGNTTKMEKVTGIGGFFFRSKDPAALAAWYEKNLGITGIPDSYEKEPWKQDAGPTAFAPFPETTKYFGDPEKQWMLNLRVKNLDAMVAQLRAAGITVDVDPQTYPNGRFAHLKDPEGNRLELWEDTRSAKTDKKD